MLTGTFEHGRENDGRDHIRIHASISLAFDWCDLLKGEIPFSAPYETPSRRFSRQMHNGLYERVVRKHDLPTDRDEKRFTLGAAVHGERVRVTGGFPGLRNAAITVQTASSPWRDRVELTTDSRGSYSGQLQLPPGTYKIRLVHKPTGLVSEERTITIEEQ
jgi:hypothetical protein